MTDEALVTVPWSSDDTLEDWRRDVRLGYAADGASSRTRDLLRHYVAAAVTTLGEDVVADQLDRAYAARILSEDLRLATPDPFLEADIGTHLEAFSSGRAIGGAAPAQVRSQLSAGNVDLFSGQFTHAATDLVVRGAGMDFAFTRTYKSRATYAGPLGPRWTHPYDLWIREIGELVVRSTGFAREEGYLRHPRFGQTGFDYWVPPDGETSVFVSNGSSYTWRGVGGRQVHYEEDPARPSLHRARRIEDRFGNGIDLHYEDRRLSFVTVNHPDRRVSFGYDDRERITDVTDYDGRRCHYVYDDYGDLVAATGPATSRNPNGLTRTYEYSSATGISAHNLIRVLDADGQVTVENEYGTARGSRDFDRVVRQLHGLNESLFEYEAVVGSLDFEYADADRPTAQVNHVMRNGHPVHYVHNRFGNLLLREEYGSQGSRLLQFRFRYNRDGNLIASLSAEGSVTQYIYGRDEFVRRHAVPPQQAEDLRGHEALTLQERLAFGNLLSLVRRAQRHDLTTLDLTGGIWGDIYPNPRIAGPDDVITKSVYEPDFQQLISFSNPRFTSNPDPAQAELPRHLVHREYTGPPGNPHLLLSRVIDPDTTQPDGTVVPGLVRALTRYDQRGRCLEDVDVAGTTTRRTYFGSLDGVREGYLRSSVRDPGGLAVQVEREVNLRGVTTTIRHPRGWNITDGRFVTRLESNALDELERVERSAPYGYATRRFFNRQGLMERVETDLQDDHGALLHGGLAIRILEYNIEGSVTVDAAGGRDPSTLLAVRHTYDGAGLRLRTTTPAGRRLGRHHDARMLKTAVTRGDGTREASTAAIEHDGDGRVVLTRNGRGDLTRYRYDALGRLVAHEDALGNVARYDYDSASNLTLTRLFERRIDGTYVLLSRTALRYDELDRLVERSHNLFPEPLPASDLETAYRAAPGPGTPLRTFYVFNARGHLEQMIDPLGGVTRFSYDALGREVERIDPLGNRVEAAYDEHGNVVRRNAVETVRDPVSGDVLRTEIFTDHFEFDELDRLVRVTDSLGNVMTYTYDSVDRLLTITDALGNVHRMEYDVWGRLVTERREMTDSGLGTGAALPAIVVRSGYDADGVLRTQTDANGNVTHHTHDALGRQTAVTYPDGAIETYEYDRADCLVAHQNPDGLRRAFTVDALGRPTRMDVDRSRLSPGMVVEGETFEERLYDGAGRLVAEGNDFCRIQSKIDSEGRIYEETVTHSGALAVLGQVSLQRTHDAAGALDRLTYPNGRVVRYVRDPLGDIVRIEQLARGVGYPGAAGSVDPHDLCTRTYAGRRLASIGYANGTSSVFAYDADARLICISHHDPSGTPLLTEQYLRDGAGNLRLRNDILAGGATRGEYLGYDSAYRLTEIRGAPNIPQFDPSLFAPHTRPSSGGAPADQAGIDTIVGTLAQGPAPTFAYDPAANRLSEKRQGLPSRAYDANALNEYVEVAGETLTYDRSGNLLVDSAVDYVYDPRHLLVRVRGRSSAADVVEFFHDPRGRRIAERRNGVLTGLTYDGPNVIEEQRPGELLRQYVHEDALDVTSQIAEGGGERWLHRDAMGSTRLVTDQTGTLVRTFTYDPFGAHTPASADSVRVLFAGRRYDPDLSAYDFRAREYAPDIGRFLQRDPIGGGSSLNLYEYAYDNPLSFTDRSGNDPDGAGIPPMYVPSGWRPLFQLADTTTGRHLGAYIDGFGTTLAENLGPPTKYLLWDMWGATLYDVTKADVFKQSRLDANKAIGAQHEFILAGPEAAGRNIAKGMVAGLDEMHEALDRGDSEGAMRGLGKFMASGPPAAVEFPLLPPTGKGPRLAAPRLAPVTVEGLIVEGAAVEGLAADGRLATVPGRSAPIPAGAMAMASQQKGPKTEKPFDESGAPNSNYWKNQELASVKAGLNRAGGRLEFFSQVELYRKVGNVRTRLGRIMDALSRDVKTGEMVLHEWSTVNNILNGSAKFEQLRYQLSIFNEARMPGSGISILGRPQGTNLFLDVTRAEQYIGTYLHWD